jgi:hypothetical protein
MRILLLVAALPALVHAQGAARPALPAPAGTDSLDVRRGRDPFENPLTPKISGAPMSLPMPPVPFRLTATIVAGAQSVATVRMAPTDQLRVLHVGEQIGDWTVSDVKSRSITLTVPREHGTLMTSVAVQSPRRLVAAPSTESGPPGLRMPDLPLLPPGIPSGRPILPPAAVLPPAGTSQAPKVPEVRP